MEPRPPTNAGRPAHSDSLPRGPDSPAADGPTIDTAARQDVEFFQNVLDRHTDEQLTERLRRLGGLGCTGSVLVFDDEVLGVAFLDRGRLIDAIVVDGPWVGEGVQAVAFLANVADPKVVYQTTTHFGKPTIDIEYGELQKQVEQIRPLLLPPLPRSNGSPPPAQASDHPGGSTAPAVPATGPPSAGPLQEPAASTVSVGATAAAPQEPAASEDSAAQSASETAVAFLRELRGVYGYLASVVMDHTGELLWSDNQEGLDLPLLAAVYNDLFRCIDDASKAQGMEGCASAVVHAKNGVVVIHSTDTAEGPRLHAVAVLRPEGNQALARLMLERHLPRVCDALI
jgi:hypothetical protein